MVTATPHPNLIAFLGDMDTNPDAFTHTAAVAANKGIGTIIQTGNIGLHHPDDLHHLQEILDDHHPNVDYRFIDGNYDNLDLLDPDTSTATPLTRNITYMPRGTREQIAGKQMLFLGGASSVDRRWRGRGHTWWPAENITTAQADRAIASATDPNQPPVDILVTHDTTTQVFDILAATSDHAAVRAGDTTDQTNRHHLTRVRDAAAPRAHVHGHHHTRLAAPVDQIMTIALNAHHHDDSVAVLDTADWSWHWLSTRHDNHERLYAHSATPPTPSSAATCTPVFAWQDIVLDGPLCSLDDYPGSTSDTGPLAPRTIWSVTAHRMTLQKIRGESTQFTVDQLRLAEQYIDAAAQAQQLGGHPIPGITEPADYLKRWISDHDIDTLATHLLDPREWFDAFHRLSPIVRIWGTEEIRLWATDAIPRTAR